MKALVLWEISKKQDYIFKSNKLKENIGASSIIQYITEKLPLENYHENKIYSGGGSSLYRFDNEDYAKKFIKEISSEVIEKYPGIELFMVFQKYDLDVMNAINEAYKKLGKKKNMRKHSGKQVSFGIEKICYSTGLPAEHTYDDDGEQRYISGEVNIKRSSDYSSNEKLNELNPPNKSKPQEFNDLRSKHNNLMAVIHIDGNNMGNNFRKIDEGFKQIEKSTERDEEYLIHLKKFSEQINLLYISAFKHMTEIIDKNLSKMELEKNIFPVIPLIVAGDDVTFVVNGQIGIESAKIFIDYIIENGKNIELYKGEVINMNACAGIAIVRTNYPFSQAYSIAKNLCNNAKKLISSNNDFSLIDWHIEHGDSIGSIEEIREKNYTANDGSKLCMRPLYINNEKEWNKYDNFIEAYSNIIKLEIDNEKIARSKLKKLREVLRNGEKETEIYINSNDLNNYLIRFSNIQNADYCFYNETCLYYDAIEAMDLYMKLEL